MLNISTILLLFSLSQANHAVDWERDPEYIRDHTKKAKCLTLTSIIIGTIICLVIVIAVIVLVVNATKTVESFESDVQLNNNGFHYNQKY